MPTRALALLLTLMLTATPAFAAPYDEAEALLAAGDNAAAFTRFEQLAIDGNRNAQYRLAQLYASGIGTAQDPAQAASWYRRAADNGLGDAQFALGVLYSTGTGLERDDGLAVDWYVNAAKQGHVDAQYNLGYMYASGRGIDQDLERARTWYQLAADQGHSRAQINLGAMYASGDGVPRDDARAADWYRMAALQGDADAQYSLGYLYEFGRGVSNDRGQALRWYGEAAEQGHIEAAHRVAALQAKLETAARRITVETANLRAGPGTDHQVIGKLSRDTPVIGIGRDGEWVEVSIPGNAPARGWLHGNLLTPQPAVVQAPPPQPATATNQAPSSAAAAAAAKPPPVAVSEQDEAAPSMAAPGADPTQATDKPLTPTEQADGMQAVVTNTGSTGTDEELTARARAAQGELEETLDERDALLQRLTAITKQTAELTAQIETMEQQRAALLGDQNTAGDDTTSDPAAASVSRPAAMATPPAAPGSSWLREGFATMLDRLDTRLLEIESRLATLESNQALLTRELQASRETRAMVIALARDMDKKLLAQRLQAVEAQAAEMDARLQAKQLQKQLAESELRAGDLERQLATRSADRAEQTQRLISLEEERDALMTGLDAAERRLADLRDQIESDDPPQVQVAPLQAEPPR
jgi:TPR repeat protein